MDPRLAQASLLGPWRPPNPPPPPPATEPPAARGGQPLADAVAAYKAAQAALARLDAADAKAQQQLWKANDHIEAAEAALADAEERGDEVRYAKLVGNRAPGGMTVPAAERQLAEAQIERDGILKARQRIQRERQQAEYAIDSRRADLTAAIAQHLRVAPEMAALAETYLAALRQLSCLQAAFRVIPRDALPPSISRWDATNFADAVGATDETLAAEWRQAIAALEADPSAPLPRSLRPRERRGGQAGK